MEAEAIGHQTKTNHQQETEAQDHQRRMTIDKQCQRLAGPHHNGYRNRHSYHHDRQMIGHTHRRDHRIQ